MLAIYGSLRPLRRQPDKNFAPTSETDNQPSHVWHQGALRDNLSPFATNVRPLALRTGAMETSARKCQYCAEPLPAEARANRRYCDENCRLRAYGRPAREEGRRCESCGEWLPEASRRNKRFCNEACKKVEARRRNRPATDTSSRSTARDRLAIVSARLVQAETALAQSRGRIRERDHKLAELRHQLAAERRSSARVIAGQASRTAGVRGQLATATGALFALRRNWSATAEDGVASVKVTGLRQQLATVQERYAQLDTRYQELVEASELAATERQQLQGVVRQWDTLCKRLYKATGGQPAAAVDKDILATWTRFREAVAAPAGNRGRMPVAGQEAGQSATMEGVR